MLKLLARYVLLLGVLFGLATQGFAREAVPCGEMAKTNMVAMPGMAAMNGCAGMQEAAKGKAPCKDTMPCCSAMANSSAAIAIDAQPALGIPLKLPILAATWPAMRVLNGREIEPDPDPPSVLG